jgi:hypothetical protein
MGAEAVRVVFVGDGLRFFGTQLARLRHQQRLHELIALVGSLGESRSGHERQSDNYWEKAFH